MTIQELYASIDGDYAMALRIMRIDKLIDKHIRKLPDNGIFKDLAEAGESMDGTRLFESAHAVKGVCANLGLPVLSGLAAEICDEFRPGTARKMSDQEVCQKISELTDRFEKASLRIKEYAGE